MPMESVFSSRRESWPPTQIRLTPTNMSIKKRSSIEPRPLLEDIDDDPLTYFLTPIPDEDEDDEMMMDLDLDVDMMDFDAGIEDASQPREAVRSVSPSSLEGLRKPDSNRPATPESDSDALTTDDDDEEEYIRFSPASPSSMLSPLRDLAMESLRFRSKTPVFGLTTNALLSPNSFPAPTSSRGRGRTNNRASPRLQTRSLSARVRENHLWREPSPDVWSIEEETEEELMSDGGVDIVAEKPKKRVRFVIPDNQ
ncbi:hypothetical protein HDV63DRAFT_77606 [Trichoderma sp. SZMC 28014]